jgi:Uma2 family endonuclease
MAQEIRTFTADDLLRLPDDGYHRYELVEGRLLTMTPAGGEHGLVAGRIHVALGAYVEQARLGVVVSADTGFKLASRPDTVRAPDVAFVGRERIASTGVPKAFWQGAPDLAVEVLSPSDSRSEMQSRIAQYLRLGVKEVWFVEPAARRLTVHRPHEPPRVLSERDTLDSGELLPGFHYPVARLFTIDV